MKISYFSSILPILAYLSLASGNCDPNQNEAVQLGSPSNVTAPFGSDVQFICCGAVKWTHEQGETSNEIGPHPNAAGVVENADANQLTATLSRVYTMRDDKGRLILVINQATETDAGHYRCHGYAGSKDVYLVVTPEKYVEGEINPAVISRGSVIRKTLMFPSDRLDEVIIYCPITGAQVIQSWLWREPILPTSEEYAKLPEGQPPSRTVTANYPGPHEGGHVEIGPKLSWARITDPLSPEAPVKLWCQFEMPSAWENKEPIVAYYAMEWELYEPISPRIFLLPIQSENITTPDSPDIQHASILQELTQAKEQPAQNFTVYENKPARFACSFRMVDPGRTEANTQLAQFVYWYRNGQPVHVPPFNVDNSLVSTNGISLLSVRSYPAWVHAVQPDTGAYLIPMERITCVVNSQLKIDPVYRVSTNTSINVDIILLPQIINQSLLSAERSEHTAVQLICKVRANGPPKMSFERSTAASAGSNEHSVEWVPVEPRYKLNIRSVPPPWDNPILHSLVLDISSLSRSDHGLYRCSAWNGAGRDYSIGQLLVRSTPKVELAIPSSNYYVEHKPWFTSCHVTGYPLSFHRGETSDNARQENEVNSTSATTTTSSSPTNTSYSVQAKVLNSDGTIAEKAELKPIQYVANKFLGINATFELRMAQREGQESIVRCEYTHSDGQVFSQELPVQYATKPPAPEISVVCTGPKAAVFSVTNPIVQEDSSPTEKIVTQKVMFAPAKNFHASGSLSSLLVYLNAQGQPSAFPSNMSLTGNGSAVNNHALVTRANLALPNTAIIPVTGLNDDTEYVFEWASGNEFGLSVMVQFMLWTKRQDTAPTIENVIHLMPTDEHLRFSVNLNDPCPYDGGARLELTDILVRYRVAKANETGDEKLVGVGPWSEMAMCETPREGMRTADTEDGHGVLWSGEAPIICEVKVVDTKENYEVQLATRNRFNRSEWFTLLYRPTQTSKSSSYCTPPCSACTFQQSLIIRCILIVLLFRFE